MKATWARSPPRSTRLFLRRPARARRARMLCGFGLHTNLGVVSQTGEFTMRLLLILVGICFSGTVFAQSAPPKVGNRQLVQLKPKAPIGCKLVGTVRGTKLWAGDCVALEFRGSTTTTDQALRDPQATGSTSPEQTESPRRLQSGARLTRRKVDKSW